MIQVKITVQIPHGIHLRVATRLVRLAQRFQSQISLRLGQRMTDARSVLGLLLLSASLGTRLDIEASGIDEHEAIQAVEDFFNDPGADDGEVQEAFRP